MKTWLAFLGLSLLVGSELCSGTATCSTDEVDAADRSCKCKISGTGTDQDGKFIDLTPLKGRNFEFKGDKYNYTYQPCLPNNIGASEPKSTCIAKEHAAACQWSTNTADHYWLCTGRMNSTKFVYSDNTWTINYTRGDYDDLSFKQYRSTSIQLNCAESATKDSIQVLYDTNTIHYGMQLTSKWACVRAPSGPSSNKSHGLSTGSVMVIIFFVVLVVYFVGGILFLRGAKGAEGAEMVPNVTFWSALPGLIKDGILFLVSLCRGEKSGYETI